MKINRALGLGIMLLVLQYLASDIWSSVESTVITGLNVAETGLGAVGEAVEQEGLLTLTPPTFPTN